MQAGAKGTSSNKMPAKKQRGQKIDASKLFSGESQEENLDWAAGHNYDEDQTQDQGTKDTSAAGKTADAISFPVDPSAAGAARHVGGSLQDERMRTCIVDWQ